MEVLVQIPSVVQGLLSSQDSYDHRWLTLTFHPVTLLTSLAVQFYLGFCSKSGTLAAWLASCQCLCISSSAVG